MKLNPPLLDGYASSQQETEIPFIASPPLSSRGPIMQPLEFELSLNKVGALLKDLLPFYGPECPVSVVSLVPDTIGTFVRGDLDGVKAWAENCSARSPMLVQMGFY
jgi:hypothetical protein